MTDTTGAAVAAAGTGDTTAAADQRRHILDCALDLMSQRGAAGTSMRQLAEACRLNVATLYHYFPSKAELLQALIEQQHYGRRLAAEDPPIDPALPARERLAAFLSWLWEQTAAEHPVMRLILGEGARGDATAQRAARKLITALDTRLAEWMAQGFPELSARHVDPGIAGRLVRRHLLALVAETLATGQVATAANPDVVGTLGSTAADDLATALLG